MCRNKNVSSTSMTSSWPNTCQPFARACSDGAQGAQLSFHPQWKKACLLFVLTVQRDDQDLSRTLPRHKHFHQLCKHWSPFCFPDPLIHYTSSLLPHCLSIDDSLCSASGWLPSVHLLFLSNFTTSPNTLCSDSHQLLDLPIHSDCFEPLAIISTPQNVTIRGHCQKWSPVSLTIGMLAYGISVLLYIQVTYQDLWKGSEIL